MLYCKLHFGTANVSQMRASVEAAKFEEIGAEFGVFKSNQVPGLKLNFCEPYVDMPRSEPELKRTSKVRFAIETLSLSETIAAHPTHHSKCITVKPRK